MDPSKIVISDTTHNHTTTFVPAKAIVLSVQTNIPNYLAPEEEYELFKSVEVNRILIAYQSNNNIALDGILSFNGKTYSIRSQPEKVKVDTMGIVLLTEQKCPTIVVEEIGLFGNEFDVCGTKEQKPIPLFPQNRKTWLRLRPEYIQSPKIGTGCQDTVRIAYITVVADCSFSLLFNNDVEKIKTVLLSNFNIVDGIYRKNFNIGISISDLKILTNCSPLDDSMCFNRLCNNTYGIDEKLDDFSKWRGAESSANALFILASNCKTGQVMGLAWSETLCMKTSLKNQYNSFISSCAVCSYNEKYFVVLAHEIGHIFGARHDCSKSLCDASKDPSTVCNMCDNCDCLNRYIMNPNGGGLNLTTFSPGSIQDICKNVENSGFQCLESEGIKNVIVMGVCGNGIVEGNEECDCGSQCDNDPCCTKDCKLKPGAKCSDINFPCCRNCQIIPASENYICSQGRNPCQKDARCDGTKVYCPENPLTENGTPCSTDGKTCIKGVCTSRDSQCVNVTGIKSILGACKRYNGCNMYCQMQDSCVDVQLLFMDGTPCGAHNLGLCHGGKCKAKTTGDTILMWLAEYYIYILLGVIVLAIFIIFIVIKEYFNRGNQRARTEPVVE